MSQVITDAQIRAGLNQPTPSYVAAATSTQVLTTTWAPITVGSNVFELDEFDYDVWDSTNIRARANDTISRDFHLRVDLSVSTPLLFARYLQFVLTPYARGTETALPGFAPLTIDIDPILSIPLAPSPYNVRYQVSPFFVQPTQDYRVMARTNVGSLRIDANSISITRNN